MRLDVFKWRSYAAQVDVRDGEAWHHYMRAVRAWVAWSTR
jgi:hypothetical protein